MRSWRRVVLLVVLSTSAAAGAEETGTKADPYGELFAGKAAAPAKEVRPTKAKPPRPPAPKVVRPTKGAGSASQAAPVPVRPARASPVEELGLSNHAAGRHAEAGP